MPGFCPGKDLYEAVGLMATQTGLQQQQQREKRAALGLSPGRDRSSRGLLPRCAPSAPSEPRGRRVWMLLKPPGDIDGWLGG